MGTTITLLLMFFFSHHIVGVCIYVLIVAIYKIRIYVSCLLCMVSKIIYASLRRKTFKMHNCINKH